MRGLFLICFFFLVTASVAANELTWPEKPYKTMAKDKPLAEFIIEFFSAQNKKVMVGENVTNDVVTGEFNLPPADLFLKIIHDYNLIWYFDGEFVYIYKSNTKSLQSLKWSQTPYVHVSEEQPLEEFFSEFCASQGIQIVLSDKVKGKTVSGKFNMAPERLFQKMVAAFDLIYYFSGDFLYIYSADEVVSKFIILEHISTGMLEDVLTQNGLLDPRYPINQYQDHNLVYISGPPGYVVMIEETAKVLDVKEARENASKPVASTVRHFPLKYAWADDVEFNIANNRVVVPGVATILRNLLTEQQAPDLETVERSGAVFKLKGMKAEGPDNIRSANPPPPARTIKNTEWNGAIQADPRLNAVVIRDELTRMPMYAEIIKRLDTPSTLVEIKATIMDVNTDALKQVGADWAARSKQEGYTHIGTSANAPASPFGQIGFLPGENINAGLANGFNFSTIIGDMTDDYIVARLNALAEDGDANVVSRPSVMTFDNVEAQLEHSENFYVRVSGEREANLFNISTGIVMKVTPHVIIGNDETKIKLVINIQDGAVTEKRVDDIPVVEQSTINTQAMVGENESLLIGGLIHEKKLNRKRKIPLLGEMPLIGVLFSYKQNSREKQERVFLISPRIVLNKTGKPLKLGDENDQAILNNS